MPRRNSTSEFSIFADEDTFDSDSVSKSLNKESDDDDEDDAAFNFRRQRASRGINHIVSSSEVGLDKNIISILDDLPSAVLKTDNKCSVKKQSKSKMFNVVKKKALLHCSNCDADANLDVAVKSKIQPNCEKCSKPLTFVCTHKSSKCPYEFNTDSLVKVSCKFCDYFSIRKYHMTRHMERVHNI
ncbi:hypothetical protein TSAR_017111 [Trichomalopsis sarcophagae]|uniref:Uncharacterized protein n=1 Tax=Trichomalopsis sarcophagae TaxID=543379 RepID=A0A232FGR7_9HYME|nr:hypothetical protein TSAR_017111 [Trichomalopsis sarcophagae]